MRRWSIVGFALMCMPQVSEAANLGPLAPLAPYGMALIALGYLFSAAPIVWCCGHAVSAYRDRDMGGIGPVFGWILVAAVGAVVLGTMIPAMLAPILAQGATL